MNDANQPEQSDEDLINEKMLAILKKDDFEIKKTSTKTFVDIYEKGKFFHAAAKIMASKEGKKWPAHIELRWRQIGAEEQK